MWLLRAADESSTITATSLLDFKVRCSMFYFIDTCMPETAHASMRCLQNIRSGNYPVIATNHTLVLNWNSQTVPLLRQIAINKVERNNATYDG